MITVLAYPDRGAGNDPTLFLGVGAGGGGGWGWGAMGDGGDSLSPPRLNILQWAVWDLPQPRRSALSECF